MKVEEAVRLWALREASETVACLNEALHELGELAPGEAVELDEASVESSFLMAGAALDPEGRDHTASPLAVPPRAVLRISGSTKDGRPFVNEKHLGEVSPLTLVAAVVQGAGGELTL